MATLLDRYMATPPDSITLTESYWTFIESMLNVIKNDPATQTVYISPEVGYLFRFNMTGFLLENSVPLEDHRLVLRVNGLSSVHDIDEFTTSLRIPDASTIARFKQIYRTSLTVG